VLEQLLCCQIARLAPVEDGSTAWTSHLGRHGIKAQAEESLRGGISISDVLLSRAADLGVDMIVAGAYHHSQARETLLGGVSRDLLNHIRQGV
jgi:nucleotide-binding universal stress UspA family protein